MDRRDFLKAAGMAGLAAATGAMPGLAQAAPLRPQRGKSVMGLKAPKLDTVRVALIGVGARGGGHLNQLLDIEGVKVVAVCDNHQPTAERTLGQFKKRNLPNPPLYTNGDFDYRRMLDRDDIDAVFISTPWEWHVEMAVDAMNAGKHAFVEVPAALTIEECWRLVDTSEATQRHCMMMENVNYGREELMLLNMCRLGLFGELLHGEAAYIHDLRGQMHEIEHGTGSWRTLHYARRNGNLYPTHGLGPVAQYMNINRGDRFDYMSSASSPARVRAQYAAQKFPEGHSRRKLKFVCGDINTSIIKTIRGRTIMVQWDEQLPRPYTRHNFVQGTKGAFGGFPNRIVVEGRGSTDDWQEGKDLDKWFAEFDHPLWKRMGELAQRMGGHGGMDFLMLWRIIDCLRNGEPLDQDVYDAAAWSAVTPLSEWSVANRSQSIDFPDFTRGMWRTGEPLGIVGS
ncbi:MAG TPA: Gfo/Idh/MocA family oxidoreductase [Fimbriimonadaceae bacterium]|nr:Gfo/Idh/MocA family oxidoreductase [Fimbriimonadaceae bacterium]